MLPRAAFDTAVASARITTSGRLPSSLSVESTRFVNGCLMTDTIISLTTIPPRMEKTIPTLESLLRQSQSIKSIILWIPYKYRRKEFGDFNVPRLPKGIDIMRCDLDYGPATKVLPAAKIFKGEDVNIIYCDDDEIYDSDWAETLVRNSEMHPRDCIAIAGLTTNWVKHAAFRRSWKFRALNALTLDIYRRVYARSNRGARPGPGIVDVCQGFGGVLIKPDFIPASAFDIPDVIWTVDDIWLSGQMHLNDVTIRRVCERKKCHKGEASNVSALNQYVYQGNDRIAADYLAMKYFQDKHGIWLD